MSQRKSEVQCPSETYFVEFEKEIRKTVQDSNVKKELLKNFAIQILKKQVQWVHVNFSDALIDGVIAIVLDELKKEKPE